MAGQERFQGLAWIGAPRADRWRKPAIVAMSVLGHLALFSWIGLRSADLPPPGLSPRPIIHVEMSPRPLSPGEVARVRLPPAPTDAVSAPARAGAPADVRARNEEEEERPAPPAPRRAAAAPGAPGPPAGAPDWSVRPETLGDRVGRGLRTRGPGCSAPDLLSAAERAVCDDRFGQRAAVAAPIDDTAGSRFAAEGRRRLADYEARRRPLAGGVGVVGPEDGPGSNFGMGVAGAHLDPSLRPDSTRNIQTRRDARQARARGD
jgi:hypothetical protein